MKSFQNGTLAMPLQRGEVQGYDFDRMVVAFTMLNQGKEILCAISTAAMDDLEGRRELKSDQRVDQFIRLREVIEERASRKFFEEQAHTDRPLCCDPTISLDNRYIPSSRIIEGAAPTSDLGSGHGAHRPITS